MSALLRRVGCVLLQLADRLEAPRVPDAWPAHDATRRIFELRTRIHCGYY